MRKRCDLDREQDRRGDDGQDAGDQREQRVPVFLWRPSVPAVAGRPDPSRSTKTERVMFHQLLRHPAVFSVLSRP